MTDAERYAAWLATPPARICEESPRRGLKSLPELEIQARWFSGEFGKKFASLAGDAIEVVQYGVWNREAGPDFSEAAVSVNGAPPVRGCIELDPDVRDWERHGHAANAAYNGVLLHVFWSAGKSEFFTRTNSGRAVPQVQLDLAQIDRAPLNPVPCAKAGRCSAPLAAMQPTEVAALLAASAHYRLQRKARRIAQAAQCHGESEAIYQFVAETLGYKSNKLPFLLLAQRLPLGAARGRWQEFEAALFGVSGFLLETDLHSYEDAARSYLRELWDGWWPRRIDYGSLAIPSSLWQCGGVRPMNHPHRRVGALAEIGRRWPKTREVLEAADARAIKKYFAALSHPYWDCHYTLTSAAAKKRMALVGPERAAGILVNVVLPLALRDGPQNVDKLKSLPAPDCNLRVKTASLRLFAKEAKLVPLLKTAVNQQGLLQIYEDFCCQDVTDCLRCRLPEQLAQWS